MSRFPAGTKLHWTPYKRDPSGKPILFSEGQYDRFVKFCRDHQIVLILPPDPVVGDGEYVALEKIVPPIPSGPNAARFQKNTLVIRNNEAVLEKVPVAILPAGQGWKVGRSRWKIENGTFNRLTRDYALTHNYHHSVAAIVALLAMRSFACFLTQAYWRYATARYCRAPARFVQGFQQVLIEDWVRYLDQALFPDRPPG